VPSHFLKEKLREIEARIGVLDGRVAELESLSREREALERARDLLAAELAAIEAAPKPSAAKPHSSKSRAGKALAPEAQRVADAVLAILAGAPGLTTDELAARTDTAPGALHRLLAVLRDRHIVVEKNGRFSVG
jgi:hypothetical protein